MLIILKQKRGKHEIHYSENLTVQINDQKGLRSTHK